MEGQQDSKGIKRRSESDPGDVQSANDWEHVDLGDSERKNKFLRLMGAAKKEHHGRFVIGDNKSSHGRSVEETQKLTSELEEQYQQGLELKVTGGARKHIGLGFQDTSHDSVPGLPVSGPSGGVIVEESAPDIEKKSENVDKEGDDESSDSSRSRDSVVEAVTQWPPPGHVESSSESEHEKAKRPRSNGDDTKGSRSVEKMLNFVRGSS